MQARLVILTGASGSGKTTLARDVHEQSPKHCEVLYFDSIGVPTTEAMNAWGDGHRPGGAWQRCMTLAWFNYITRLLAEGKSVLFEGQMRIAFIMEAIERHQLTNARVILVDCDDATRTERLHLHRAQPELADAQMMGWARYLREEALQWQCQVMDTGQRPFAQCVAHLISNLQR